MATNCIQNGFRFLSVAADSPASPTSGQACRWKNMVGVAVQDEGDGGNTSTETTLDFGPAVYDLSCKGANDAGNVAIAVGDALYFVDGDAFLSKKQSGRFAGTALEAVSSGSTSTIEVAIGVGEPKIGIIPLDLGSLREIATNDIAATAADAGVLATDTTPAYERVNAATDKSLRVRWAASNVDEVQFPPIPMPYDLDGDKDIVVHLLAKMAGATDTPTIDVQVFDGVGDTEMGAATAALSATLQDLTVTVAAADIAGPPTGYLNIALVPGAHGTDALDLVAAWIEYHKK